MEYAEYKSLLKERLSKKRYIHSLNVADSAVILAQKYGADEEKAYLAGFLHDICKEDLPENQLKTLNQFGIMIDSVEMSTKKLWHAICGAIYIENILGITDSDILNAVRYHTTGRKGMSILEKVIYIADFISADRSFEGVQHLRKASGESLSKAMDIALSFSIVELIGKGKPIHEDTLAAYNDLILNKNKDYCLVPE